MEIIQFIFMFRGMSTWRVHLKRNTCVKLVENHPEEDINYSDFISIIQALLVH